MSQADELIKNLERELSKISPAPGPVKEPGALVLQAKARGEAVLARKFFNAGDRSYQPGEEVEGLTDDQLSKMAEAGYIVPRSLHDKGKAAAEIRDKLGQVMPLRGTLQAARSDAAKLAKEIAEMHGLLLSLEAQLRDKSAFIDYCENNIVAFMSGDDVTPLLAAR